VAFLIGCCFFQRKNHHFAENPAAVLVFSDANGFPPEWSVSVSWDRVEPVLQGRDQYRSKLSSDDFLLFGEQPCSAWF
jgi:hypothetical protein